jgi:hypothetical protein
MTYLGCGCCLDLIAASKRSGDQYEVHVREIPANASPGKNKAG